VGALRTAGPAGPAAGLDSTQVELVVAAFARGARACGYATELWTLARMADVIEREAGVHYHPCSVWKVLRRLDWSSQRPARQAKERDELAIDAWKSEAWPLVKGGLRMRRMARFRGRSGRLPEPSRAQNVGAEGPPTSHQAKDARLSPALLDGELHRLSRGRFRRSLAVRRTTRLVQLREPHRGALKPEHGARRADYARLGQPSCSPLRGQGNARVHQRIALVDGSSTASLRPRPQPCRGSLVGPEGSDLANLCAADRAELERAARNGLQRITENQAILWGCLRHTGLELNRRDSTDKAQ
jgi:hypothetical protein